MDELAALIDALVYTRSRNEKLRLIAEYLRATPDPDRGWALAALTDGLDALVSIVEEWQAAQPLQPSCPRLSRASTS